MKYSFVVLFPLVLLICACQSHKPESYFDSREERDSVLLKLSPYVLRQPEEVTDSIWYTHLSDQLRKDKLNKLSSQLFKYHKDKNGVEYYCVYQRDNRSLYEDYRGYGGKYTTNNGNIKDLEELFITPQLKIDQVKNASAELFDEIVKQGDAKKYIGKTEVMQWPNETVVYNMKTHKWDITKNNDYYFVKEMKDSVARADSISKAINRR